MVRIIHLPSSPYNFLQSFVWFFTCFFFVVFQFSVLKKFLEDGGAILVMLREGGESRYGTNINFLLEEYGIVFNNGNGAH